MEGFLDFNFKFHIYCYCAQGNHIELQKMTGWYGPKVLYFGDHVYSDLAVSKV